MDTLTEVSLDHAPDPANDLHEVRRESGAEQLTPEKRKELMGKAEEIRREIAEAERKQQEAATRAVTEESKATEMEARLKVSVGNDVSIMDIVRGENKSLAEIYGRTEKNLSSQLSVVEKQLQTTSPRVGAPAPAPEVSVPETAKNLQPDLTKELGNSLNKPAANDTAAAPIQRIAI